MYPGVIASSRPKDPPIPFVITNLDEYSDNVNTTTYDFNLGVADNTPMEIALVLMGNSANTVTGVYLATDSGHVQTYLNLEYQVVYNSSDKTIVAFGWIAPTGSDMNFNINGNWAERYGTVFDLGARVDVTTLTSQSDSDNENDLNLSVDANSLSIGTGTAESADSDVGLVGMTPLTDLVRPNADNTWMEIGYEDENNPMTRTISVDNNGVTSDIAINLVNFEPTQAAETTVSLTWFGSDIDAAGGPDFTWTAPFTPSASEEYIFCFLSRDFTNQFHQLTDVNGVTPELLGMGRNQQGEIISFWYVTGLTSSSIVVANDAYYYGACAAYRVTNFNRSRYRMYSHGTAGEGSNLTVYEHAQGVTITVAALRGAPLDFSVSGPSTFDVNEANIETDYYWSVGTGGGSGGNASYLATPDVGFENDTFMAVFSMAPL